MKDFKPKPNWDTVILLHDNIIKFLVFQVGENSYGIDILEIEGLNRVPEITTVPDAPNYIKGLLNLRGQLVTVIDLGERLGLEVSQQTKNSRIIIVKLDMEYIGLLVDAIVEVVPSPQNSVEPLPANTTAGHTVFFSGVIKKDNLLTTILNVGEIIKVTA